MPWIEIDAGQRLEFNRIESEWLRDVPIATLSPQQGPAPDGKMRINAPAVLIQHLRNGGFPFREVD